MSNRLERFSNWVRDYGISILLSVTALTLITFTSVECIRASREIEEVVHRSAMRAKAAENVTTGFRLSVTKLIDGDTLIADIHVGLDGMVFKDQRIRFADIDCWELSKRRGGGITDDELVKGLKARESLEKHVRNALVVTAFPDLEQRDVYGRRLMHVFVDDQPIADILRQEGHERATESN